MERGARLILAFVLLIGWVGAMDRNAPPPPPFDYGIIRSLDQNTLDFIDQRLRDLQGKNVPGMDRYGELFRGVMGHLIHFPYGTAPISYYLLQTLALRAVIQVHQLLLKDRERRLHAAITLSQTLLETTQSLHRDLVACRAETLARIPAPPQPPPVPAPAPRPQAAPSEEEAENLRIRISEQTKRIEQLEQQRRSSQATIQDLRNELLEKRSRGR